MQIEHQSYVSAIVQFFTEDNIREGTGIYAPIRQALALHNSGRIGVRNNKNREGPCVNCGKHGVDGHNRSGFFPMNSCKNNNTWLCSRPISLLKRSQSKNGSYLHLEFSVTFVLPMRRFV